MEEQIQVSFHLPAEALGQLAQLLEQVRQLMGTPPGTPAGKTESEASPSFDDRRFQELLQGQGADREPVPPARRAVPVENAPLEEAPATKPAVFSPMEDTPTAAPSALSPVDAAPAQAPELKDISPMETFSPGTADLPEAAAASGENFFPLTEAPSAGHEVSGPGDDTVSPEAPMAPLPEADVLHSEDMGILPEIPTAQSGAGTSLPPPPSGVWGSLGEELTSSGPAPLTAEAVSLAFHRDDRRYDRGFPLY